MGRTDFSRILIFAPPDFVADFAAGCFLLIFVGKSAQKNPPGKSPTKSSKFYTAKIPDNFLQSGQANISLVLQASLLSKKGSQHSKFGGVVKTLRIVNLLSRSLFATAGSFGWSVGEQKFPDSFSNNAIFPQNGLSTSKAESPLRPFWRVHWRVLESTTIVWKMVQQNWGLLPCISDADSFAVFR